ncbi:MULTISPECIES: hypothetical protein [unclassified Pseudomonas]|uniref:hypothetical protein n=1 Tax=unclassified Pseudomonas TaxID=196821 RepID=UPI000CD2BE4F|nr:MULTISPECIES: hypothetical protein [unclassified Pseudomonas]POA52154.1 hypothetical protein C1889_24325 [Pseudomonas sp. FW507-12TSA]
MELIYTNQLEGFDPDKRYRTASLFRGIERDATAVVVVGDYPDIVAAYEAAGVDVLVEDAPAALVPSAKAPACGDLADEVAKLRAENGAVILLLDGLDAGEIQRPESGELAIRLFESLGIIHVSVGELTTERDGLLLTVDALRGEVEALKKAVPAAPADEAGEIAALKAKLDEAKVQYRANASKESLEKLIADLPKA